MADVARVLSIGYPIALTQNQVYAVPGRLVHIFASAAIEISDDGVTFVAATGANTVGIFCSAAFLRCTGTTGIVTLKGT